MTAPLAHPPAASAGRFERPVRVRFGHCDPAGIVFFPQFFVLFSGLVEDWVTEGLGIPYAGLLGPRRTGLPTVSLQTDFRAVCRMGEAIVLGLQVAHLGTRSFTLALDARGDGGRSADERVRMRQVIVCTSLDTHRAVALPTDLRAAIERFGVAA